MKIILTLIRIFTTLLYLAEGEGKKVRASVMRLGWAVAFIAISSLLVLAALVFLLLGIYQYFALQMAPVSAAFIVSLSAFGLALI